MASLPLCITEQGRALDYGSSAQCGLLHPRTGRWGIDGQVYGGVGRAAVHVIRQGGVVSRSHRHYGTGVINCFAQKQPYRVTDLRLSDCRPYDQLLPPPLLTNEIIHHSQLCRYPTCHTYTSHRSKFAVFPSPTNGSHPLTQNTANALYQCHQLQFCTTTNKQTYSTSLSSLRGRGTLNQSRVPPTSNNNNRSPTVDNFTRISGEQQKIPTCDGNSSRKETNIESSGTNEDGRVDVERSASPEKNALEENSKPTVENCNASVQKILPSKDELDDDLKDDSSGLTDHVNPSSVTKQAKRVHWQDERVERGAEVDDVRKERLREEDLRQDGGDSSGCDNHGEKKMERGVEVVVANYLPQLPDHFRRVSTKYCRNKLSPIWPCSVPFYLQRPHSILQTSIPSPVKLPIVNPESVKEEESVAMAAEDKDEDDVMISEVKGEDNVMVDKEEGETSISLPALKDVQIGDDVTGESPSVPPPLSAMLHVSGSRVPHRLGVRFRTQAHTRYHQLYPDPIPDLRDARIETKKYFFYDFHSSVFRGS